MAKAKAPVYYCKWCDEVMKTDCQFCSGPCRKIWTKTRNTPTEEIISMYQRIVVMLKQDHLIIQGYCKDRYEIIKRDVQNYTGDAKKLATVEGSLFAYIYNKKKDEAFKAFAKYKQLSQDSLDACLFDGKESGLYILSSDGTKTYLDGEEALRVDAITTKLSVQAFELMLQQTFP